ncbi:S-adenosylmethionine:tRNA ribosyltransferase-isomerase [Kibdelosporangium philippinense]|uniref:S-adenosylmethionine:tRNA ribosyltransferase-isomerase n=1 Tax=Kibdelosporangium philippinense TaxID=211113 RepID=A0ABS8ZG43_9PSEU|nr:S-adenosylmethionine:tRNA ribosyltransferase-isomerase [Kibdelosporangium philippinense]MCE7006249.1 S-adenosylmethionine:tRNA ribosyltransferase-isomerase [Kibdelosporangium philippinense]
MMISAVEPPEARGVPRDGVRMLVASPSGVKHAYFNDLTQFLRPGDLVVVNNSGTMAAAVDGSLTVHFSTWLDDGSWVVELRPEGTEGRAGQRISLPEGHLELIEPYMSGRLWRARASMDVPSLLARFGRPIKYSYVPQQWPLTDYQTVFARDSGSAEMPSAGRPFSAALVTKLVSAGVLFAPITLHTGVSSIEEGKPPLPERFHVPAATARLVSMTRAAGGRVIAVGTTVTRALESAPHGGEGWTELVLGPSRPAKIVNGLITGWHAPGASHLQLLQAVAGRELIDVAYEEAAREGYLWHEFGDSCLLLPA